MMWGYRAYNDWRQTKLSSRDTYDVRILKSDLNDCKNLDKKCFEYSMCKFLAEVVKVKDGSEYPGHTLYQLVVSIQKFLFIQGIKWKLVEGDFDDLRCTLDNLMKDRAAKSIGTVKKQANMLTYRQEQKMWDSGYLGESNPMQLRETVIFRWFKFTLKPRNSITHGKLQLAIWDTSFWTFWLKFGHNGP